MRGRSASPRAPPLPSSSFKPRSHRAAHPMCALLAAKFMLDCERVDGGFRGHFWHELAVGSGGRESLWYSPIFGRVSMAVRRGARGAGGGTAQGASERARCHCASSFTMDARAVHQEPLSRDSWPPGPGPPAHANAAACPRALQVPRMNTGGFLCEEMGELSGQPRAGPGRARSVGLARPHPWHAAVALRCNLTRGLCKNVNAHATHNTHTHTHNRPGQDGGGAGADPGGAGAFRRRQRPRDVQGPD